MGAGENEYGALPVVSPGVDPCGFDVIAATKQMLEEVVDEQDTSAPSGSETGEGGRERYRLSKVLIGKIQRQDDHQDSK
jgi:hypothetical protein